MEGDGEAAGARPGFWGWQVHVQVWTEETGKGPEAMEKHLPMLPAQRLEHGLGIWRPGPRSVPPSAEQTLPYLGPVLPITMISKGVAGFHVLTCGDSDPQKPISKHSHLRVFWVTGMAGSFKVILSVHSLASRWAHGREGQGLGERGQV